MIEKRERSELRLQNLQNLNFHAKVRNEIIFVVFKHYVRDDLQHVESHGNVKKRVVSKALL